MEDTTIHSYDNYETNQDNQFDEINIRIYRNYSVNVSDLPKNFVPIIKPKEIIFGDEEEIVPFSLCSYSSEDNFVNNNNYYIKSYNDDIMKSHSFNQSRTNRKNTILKKLIEKNQLSKIINFF
jgi:hypothetical protein